MTKKKKDTLVVGVGNPVLRDEGLGIHAVRKLQELKLPHNVEVMDCGCDLLKLTSHFNGHRKIIIVDAIKSRGAPGKIYRFDLEEIVEKDTRFHSVHPVRDFHISQCTSRKDSVYNISVASNEVHMIDAVSSLKLLKKLYPEIDRCQVILIGMEPEIINAGFSLSGVVETKIDNLIEAISEEF